MTIRSKSKIKKRNPKIFPAKENIFGFQKRYGFKCIVLTALLGVIVHHVNGLKSVVTICTEPKALTSTKC